ncbi:unnamed protein product [Spirodela intermedia]|uniref:Uncharacterized protein n=2 Tax=Spirodela intermedia TaxID=51605 RepID=A0A7I8JMT9_SPIIN|nr:unnamed protein product [Spirodela intermedia]CAA6671121.1 unnamed protein product [Spirodela intermedia]CAA7408232.1 unnamed protein product [Spirodela intermedia]
MAKGQQAADPAPWLPESFPFLVVVLIAAHALALVYWIYRLVTEKQPPRRKEH